MRSAILRRAGYLLYLIVAVAVPLELLLRFGVIPNLTHRRGQSMSLPAARATVLVLGDSFTLDREGLLGEKLREHLAMRGVASLNLAAGGEGPMAYREKYRVHGVPFRPDVVVVNYYVGNDLTDTLWMDPSRGVTRLRLRERLRRSYLLAHLIDMRTTLLRERRLTARHEETRGTPLDLEGLNPFMIDVGRAHPEFVTENLLIESPDARRAWEANRQALDDIAREARGHGARTLVNILPSSLQVTDEEFALHRLLGITVDRRTLVESRPQELLAAACRSGGYTCLDLLPAFRSAEGHLFRDNDSHWNAAGTELAFDLIRPELDALVDRVAHRSN